jgi:hypothetical protein
MYVPILVPYHVSSGLLEFEQVPPTRLRVPPLVADLVPGLVAHPLLDRVPDLVPDQVPGLVLVPVLLRVLLPAPALVLLRVPDPAVEWSFSAL